MEKQTQRGTDDTRQIHGDICLAEEEFLWIRSEFIPLSLTVHDLKLAGNHFKTRILKPYPLRRLDNHLIVLSPQWDFLFWKDGIFIYIDMGSQHGGVRLLRFLSNIAKAPESVSLTFCSNTSDKYLLETDLRAFANGNRMPTYSETCLKLTLKSHFKTFKLKFLQQGLYKSCSPSYGRPALRPSLTDATPLLMQKSYIFFALTCIQRPACWVVPLDRFRCT